MCVTNVRRENLNWHMKVHCLHSKAIVWNKIIIDIFTYNYLLTMSFISLSLATTVKTVMFPLFPI